MYDPLKTQENFLDQLEVQTLSDKSLNQDFQMNNNFTAKDNLKIDDSHMSSNFIYLGFDHAIVQKAQIDKIEFHTYTNVDTFGNVLDSGFNSKGY